jgi:hypothetical protein
MSKRDGNGAQSQRGIGYSPVVPFLLGTAVGGLAGAVIGTLLSGHAAHLFSTLIEVVERRDADERGRPKFELLLQ